MTVGSDPSTTDLGSCECPLVTHDTLDDISAVQMVLHGTPQAKQRFIIVYTLMKVDALGPVTFHEGAQRAYERDDAPETCASITFNEQIGLPPQFRGTRTINPAPLSIISSGHNCAPKVGLLQRGAVYVAGTKFHSQNSVARVCIVCTSVSVNSKRRIRSRKFPGLWKRRASFFARRAAARKLFTAGHGSEHFGLATSPRRRFLGTKEER